MRRIAGVLNLAFIVPVACALFLSSARAQTTEPFEENPAAMLALLAGKNGLDASGAQAWHLKLSYDHFDSDGDNDTSGTYEEWWAGPKKYKRIYSGDSLHRTEFATEKGLFFSGDQKWPQQVEEQVRAEIVDPLHTAANLGPNTKLDKIAWTIGATQLPCVIIRQTDRIISDNGLRKYCFGSKLQVIRYTRGAGWDETVYNDVFTFQDRRVGRNVDITHAGKKYLEIRVTTLDAIAADAPDFTPTPDAVAIDDVIELEGRELSEHLEKPLHIDDRLQGSQGKFVLELMIGKDGRVKSAKAVEGPEKLRRAAEDAARKMQFRPFLILDKPVEVKTTWILDVHKKLYFSMPKPS